jgi:hypothetical protein
LTPVLRRFFRDNEWSPFSSQQLLPNLLREKKHSLRRTLVHLSARRYAKR